MSSANPIYELTGNVEGRKTSIRLWPDRLEWEQGRNISVGKVALGIVTYGASLLATGVKDNKDGFVTLPLQAITGIGIKKNTMTTRLVEVQAGAANAVVFAVPRAEADRFRQAVSEAMRTPHAAVEVQHSIPTSPDPATQLRQIAELRDAGVLTEIEFETKKSEILSRM